MKNLIQFVEILFLTFFGSVLAEQVRYDDFALYRVVPENIQQLEYLHSLSLQLGSNYDFWTYPKIVNASVDILVSPYAAKKFENDLINLNIKYDLHIENVQQLIEGQKHMFGAKASFGWNDYYTLQQVNDWLDSVVRNHPRVVSHITGGRSYEGRPIRGVKVSHRTGNPGIFIESGIHAREWITVAVVTYILNELLTSNNTNIRFIAENYDWYIFPTINPDGYEYSHTTNRLWRKSRSRGVRCDGVDLNRNWDNYWMQGGASSNECTETYAGPEPFSEIEARSLSEYMRSISRNIQVYLCFHSYSQLLMLPYGHRYEELSNYNLQKRIGDKAAASLARRYGTRFEVGSIVDVIYVATGGSMDWVASTLNTPFTFEWELRDTGRYGFLLPPEQIIPTSLETLDSVITILEETYPYLVG